MFILFSLCTCVLHIKEACMNSGSVAFLNYPVMLMFFTLQLCVWSTDGWEKQASKFLQIPPGRAASSLADTRVQFHLDQIHLLAVHETQIAIYEAPKLECLKQVWPLTMYLFRNIKLSLLNGYLLSVVMWVVYCTDFDHWTTPLSCMHVLNSHVSIGLIIFVCLFL